MADSLIMYGTKTCSDCARARFFLEQHKIAYSEILLDENPDSVDTVLELTNGDARTPVLVFPDGSLLIEPTTAELQKKFGM